MDRSKVSAKDLKALLLAHHNINKISHHQKVVRIYAEMQISVPEKEAGTSVLENQIADWMTTVISERLLDEQWMATDLIVSDDCDHLVQFVVDAMEKEIPMGDEEKEEFRRFVKMSFEGLLEIVQDISVEGRTFYDQQWQTIEVIYDIADREGVGPIEVLSIEGLDKIARQRFSREEYVAQQEKSFSKIIDPEVIKSVFFEPVLKMLGGSGDEERLAEFQKELEQSIMPEVNEFVNKFKEISGPFMKEDLVRIYGESA
ncbi:hypothetical protein ACFL2R_04420 [Patescibacteria group bacterium]